MKDNTNICHHCGHSVDINAAFCANCGAPVNSTATGSAPRATHNVAIPVQPTHGNGKNNILIILGVLIVIAAIITTCLILFTDTFTTSERDASHATVETEITGQKSRENLTSSSTARYPGDLSNPDPRFQAFDWLQYSNISPSDLTGLDSYELRLLRNAIYAMHGYRFNSYDLQEYFSNFSWYTPNYTDVTHMLSQTELNNIQTIKSYE